MEQMIIKSKLFIICIFLALISCEKENAKITELEEKIEAKKERIDSIQAQQPKVQQVQQLDYNYYYNTISGLLIAEDQRDFGRIQSYYANLVMRYWDWYDVDKTELNSLYEKSWATTAWSKNTIRDIIQVNENTYDLYNTFRFYWIREEREKTIKSRVRFVFNRQGKIVEVYGIN